MRPSGFKSSAVVALCRHAAVSGAVLLAALAASAQTPRVERYLGPPPGTTWSNRVLSSGSFGQNEETQAHRVDSRDWGGERVTAIDGPTGTLLINANGEWVAFVDAQGEALLRWTPPIGPAFPLEVGKTWSRTSTQVRRNGGEQRFTEDCRVESYGDVTVPAGTFAAFHVACRSTAGQNNELWFAPQLGISVRRVLTRTPASGAEGRQVTELVSHGGR